jgi:hypothetical protein
MASANRQRATRLEARTERILRGSGIMFVIWQLAYFVVFPPAPALRSVDIVSSLGFLAWAAALLMLVATGGGAFRAPEVREILQDELARARRAVAYQHAFWAVMLVSLAGYVAAHFTQLPARLLAHVSLSIGVVVAVATVAYLNRR